MGRNIDIGELINAWEMNCPICHYRVDRILEEVDMDCDVKNHKPMQFEVSGYCSNCNNSIRMIADIKTKWERDD